MTPHGDWKEIIRTLKDKFHTVKLPQSFLAVNLSERAAGDGGDKDVKDKEKDSDAKEKEKEQGKEKEKEKGADQSSELDVNTNGDVVIADAASVVPNTP